MSAGLADTPGSYQRLFKGYRQVGGELYNVSGLSCEPIKYNTVLDAVPATETHPLKVRTRQLQPAVRHTLQQARAEGVSGGPV
jgi:hypothetical protein